MCAAQPPDAKQTHSAATGAASVSLEFESLSMGEWSVSRAAGGGRHGGGGLGGGGTWRAPQRGATAPPQVRVCARASRSSSSSSSKCACVRAGFAHTRGGDVAACHRRRRMSRWPTVAPARGCGRAWAAAAAAAQSGSSRTATPPPCCADPGRRRPLGGAAGLSAAIDGVAPRCDAVLRGDSPPPHPAVAALHACRVPGSLRRLTATPRRRCCLCRSSAQCAALTSR